MAAILGRPGAKRRSSGIRYENVHVEDQGRRYRVCATHYGRVVMVMLKCPAGGERYVDPQGRRGRKIVKLSGVKLTPGVVSR